MPSRFIIRLGAFFGVLLVLLTTALNACVQSTTVSAIVTTSTITSGTAVTTGITVPTLTVTLTSAVTTVIVTVKPTVTITVSSTPPGTTTVTVPPTTGSPYNVWELRYRLFNQFPDYFWCDPHMWPIGRPDAELTETAAQFPAIEANQEEFAAILNFLNLDYKDKYSQEEQLLIFRQHKKLNLVVQLTGSATPFGFVIRTGEGQGWRIEGTITSQGIIVVTKKEVSFNTCPICLSQGTLIDTPEGPVPVEEIRPGATVWTVDEHGNRMAARVLKTSSTSAPVGWVMVKVTLADGRMVTVSPGHPTPEKRALGDYRAGDSIDGVIITAIERVVYGAPATFDLLPEGPTGFYWANGILLGSTLM